jgi:hypothetical protein
MPATRLYGAIANARFLPHCRVITLAMLYPRADLEAPLTRRLRGTGHRAFHVPESGN